MAAVTSNSLDLRLSYLHASDRGIADDDLVGMFNPMLNLYETFNSLVAAASEEDSALLRVFLRVRPLLPGERNTDQDNKEGVPVVKILDEHCLLLTAPSSSNTFKNAVHGIAKLTHKFSFSHIYGPKTTQLELYDKTTSGMVTKFISGQNCLLFTYGATNSGKTYTIQGSASNQGLLPRTLHGLFSSLGGRLYPRRDLKPQYFCALVSLDERQAKQEEARKEALFKHAAAADHSMLSRSTGSVNSSIGGGNNSRAPSPDSSLNATSADNSKEVTGLEGMNVTTTDTQLEGRGEDGLVYAVFVSFAEIYNETVFDLLERLPPGCKKRNAHPLGEDRNAASYIKGLYEVRVDSAAEALCVLEAGRQNLHFATTRLNHNSSRSHCIFTVKLVHIASPDTPRYARISMFSVCDLAGAERVCKTQGTGDRLKEAGNINTSLLVLSRCIAAMRNNQLSQRCLAASGTAGAGGAAAGNKRREVPVPYRDSKLTRLLQSFFLGQGVAAMVVNISETPDLFDETLQVLKFSAIAKKVITNHDQSMVTAQQQVQAVVRPRSSQFRRLIRQSLNKQHGKRSSAASTVLGRDSSNVGRLSVPWIDKTTGKPNDTSGNITFGEDPKDETMKTVLEEQDEEEDEEEDDDATIQALVEQMMKLRNMLESEHREKKELEVKLRKELCTEFSQRLVEVEGNWRRRLEAEQSRADEFHDWRIARLTEYYNDTMQPRKRPRCDDGDDDDLDNTADVTVIDDSVLHGSQEIAKIKQLQDRVAELEDDSKAREAECASLYETLKKTAEVGKKAQEEATRVTFQLAQLTRHYDEAQEQLEEQKQKIASAAATIATDAAAEGGDTLVAELQRQMAAAEVAMTDIKTELGDTREMLVEAAEAYSGKEEEVNSKEFRIHQLTNALAEQSVALEQVSQEVAAAQELSSQHVVTLEERESQLEERQQCIISLKKNLRSVKDTLAAAEGTAADNNSLLRDKSRLLLEVAELKRQLKQQKEDSSCGRCGNDVSTISQSSNVDIIISGESKEPCSEGENIELENLREKLENTEKSLYSERVHKENLLIMLEEETEKKIRQETVEEFEQLKEDLLCTTERLACAEDLNERLSKEKNLTDSQFEIITEKVNYLNELRETDQGHINSVQSELSEVKAECRRVLEEQHKDCAEVVQLKDELQRLHESEEASDRVRRELEEFKDEQDVHEHQLRHLRNQLEDAARNLTHVKQLKVELSNAMEEADDKQNIINTLTLQLQTGREREVQFVKYREQFEEIREEIGNLRTKGEEREESENHLRKAKESEIQELTDEITVMLAKIEKLHEECTDIKEKKKNLQIKLEQEYQATEILKQNEEQIDELKFKLESVRINHDKSSCEKDSHIAKLEDKIQSHIGTLRYKSCEFTSLQKECDDQRRQLNVLRGERQSDLEKLAELEKESKVTGKSEQELEVVKQEVIVKLAEMESASKGLEERLVKEKHELVHQVTALEARLTCITAADKVKIDKLKDDVRKSRETNQILQKEVCAVREARMAEVLELTGLREQVTVLKDSSVQKDAEINTLQAEVKKVLSGSIAVVTPSRPPPPLHLRSPVIKQERTVEDGLRDQLRVTEGEVSKLMLELSGVRLQTEGEHFMASVVQPSTPARALTSAPALGSLPASLPPKGADKDNEGGFEPASNITNTTTVSTVCGSTVSTVTSDVPRSSASTVASTSTNVSSARRSTRKTCAKSSIAITVSAAISADNEESAESVDEEKDEEDESNAWQPSPPHSTVRKSAAAKKRVRRSKKTTAKIYNPHLDNQENCSSFANTFSSIPEKEERSGGVADGKIGSRSRRRRVLYNADALDEPLHCSPQLVDMIPAENSPHTVVRRKLRGKQK